MMLIFEAMNMPDKNFTYSKQDKQQARRRFMNPSLITINLMLKIDLIDDRVASPKIVTTGVVQLFAVLSPHPFSGPRFSSWPGKKTKTGQASKRSVASKARPSSMVGKAFLLSRKRRVF
jgi:hypothetical protein